MPGCRRYKTQLVTHANSRVQCSCGHSCGWYPAWKPHSAHEATAAAGGWRVSGSSLEYPEDLELLRSPRLCLHSSVRLAHCDEATTCMLATEAVLSPHSTIITTQQNPLHFTTWSVVELCVPASRLRMVAVRVSVWYGLWLNCATLPGFGRLGCV